jgi:flavin-dependent dehydrogenase
VTRRQFDVAIIGGGPAGLTTAIAMLHASPSLRGKIAVLEKARYPREKFCAGGLGGRGDRLLDTMNARPDVPSVEVRGMSYAGGQGAIRVHVDRVIGRVVRRAEYDHALARIAAERGTEIIEGARVEEIAITPACAAIATTEGTFEARFVVGADGVGSIVRRTMGLSAGELRAQVLEVDTEPHASDAPRDLLHFDSLDQDLPGYSWDFPTLVDGKPLVCRGTYHLKLPGAQAREIDLAERLGARLAKLGIDLKKLKNKRFAERGFVPRERVVSGPLLLTGEAAGIDAVTGEGIVQALEYGVMAGKHVANAVAGYVPFTDWQRVVDRSRLSRDLRARWFAGRAFLDGSRRASIERMFATEPAILRAGSLYFGGFRQEPLTLAKAAVGVARMLL